MIPPTPSDQAEYPSPNPTTLQRHVAFWDKDNDGVIWPSDVYIGLRALGFGVLFCIVGTFFICSGLSYWTLDTWLPDPFFRIRVSGIHGAKHGSDSETYTEKGLFNKENFEEIFSTYADPPNHDTLTLPQIFKLIRGNANPLDFFGQTANFLEWIPLYILISPEDGRITKEQVRQAFDGSLFWAVADNLEKIKQAREEREKTESGRDRKND